MPMLQRDVKLGLALLLVAGIAGAIVMFHGSGSDGAQTEFASKRDGGEAAVPPPVPFDGRQAMAYLKDIVALGPRISDTPAHAKMVDLLEKHFTEQGLKVTRQKFEARQVSKLNKVPMVNLIARWKPEKKDRLLVCTHYDTRPIAHNDTRVNWSKPFLGANDGGSGAAWMMEMARHLKQLDPELGVDFVCFDGEEYVFETYETNPNNPDVYFLGSRHFAQQYARDRADGTGPTYREGVLLDMVAGKNPRFLMEQNSVNRAGPVVNKIWGIARQQRCRTFVAERGKPVEDDHLALLDVGVPTIDIIPVFSERTPDGPGQFLSYPHWHMITDTLDNCGPEGMEQVAQVLSVWMKTAK